MAAAVLAAASVPVLFCPNIVDPPEKALKFVVVLPVPKTEFPLGWFGVPAPPSEAPKRLLVLPALPVLAPKDGVEVPELEPKLPNRGLAGALEVAFKPEKRLVVVVGGAGVPAPPAAVVGWLLGVPRLS